MAQKSTTSLMFPLPPTGGGQQGWVRCPIHRIIRQGCSFHTLSLIGTMHQALAIPTGIIAPISQMGKPRFREEKGLAKPFLASWSPCKGKTYFRKQGMPTSPLPNGILQNLQNGHNQAISMTKARVQRCANDAHLRMVYNGKN